MWAREKALAAREDEFVGGQGARMSRLELEHVHLNEAQAALEAENAALLHVVSKKVRIASDATRRVVGAPLSSAQLSSKLYSARSSTRLN